MDGYMRVSDVVAALDSTRPRREVIEAFGKIPVVSDVEPVKFEYWEHVSNGWGQCSACGGIEPYARERKGVKTVGYVFSNFCPNCGAHMDKALSKMRVARYDR